MTDGSKPARRLKLSAVELITVVVLLAAGTFISVMTPVGAGYDEDQHLYRVWQLSDLQFITREIPARQAKFPEIYFELSYRKQPLIESVGFDYWAKYGSEGLYDRGYHYGPLHSRSNYSPVLLFPQAMTMRYLGRKAELPALWVYYATRLAGLLAYTLLAWLAVRWLPYGKWILMVLAAAPMAVYQAATISADSISNGIGLMFVAGCLAIQTRGRLGWKDWGELILLTALLFMTKPNLFPLVLLPFLIIPPSRFSKRSLHPLWIAATLLLFAIIVLGWNAISPNAGLADSGQVNASEQLRYILSHPLVFTRTILGDLLAQGPRHLIQWVGVYGYGYGNVPVLTYAFFAASLGLALLVRTETQAPDRRVRTMLVLVFAAAYLFTLLALYLTFTAVAEDFVYGVQGRYLIPIFPLLFLALYDLPALRRFKGGRAAGGCACPERAGALQLRAGAFLPCQLRDHIL